MKTANIKREALLFSILFMGMVLVAFFFFNAQAFVDQIRYSYFGPPEAEEILDFGHQLGAVDTTPIPPVATTTPVEPAETLKPQPAAPPPPPSAPATTEVVAPGASAQSAVSPYRLVIPKIGVNVPMVFPSDDSMKAILASLEQGVGIYHGSDLPAELGRTVVLGHSSRASWYRGDYATVFSLLPKLEQLDEFYVLEGNKKHRYIVFAKQYLSPAETNAVLSGMSAGSEIDLITCYPIGSASQRTLIRAKYIETVDM
jgi:LPXTG-site transpeptidase (sortase) family protein